MMIMVTTKIEYLLITSVHKKVIIVFKMLTLISNSHANSLKNLIKWLKICISTFLVEAEFAPKVNTYIYTST